MTILLMKFKFNYVEKVNMFSRVWLHCGDPLPGIVRDWISWAFFVIKSNLLTDEGSKCSSTLLLLCQINDKLSLMGKCCTICSDLLVNPHVFVTGSIIQQAYWKWWKEPEKQPKGRVWNPRKRQGGQRSSGKSNIPKDLLISSNWVESKSWAEQ